MNTGDPGPREARCTATLRRAPPGRCPLMLSQFGGATTGGWVRLAGLVTIALTLKVNDGVVLAADSASTLAGGNPNTVVNVYNNANKVTNLRKGLPIGLLTWGLGEIGGASISTLAKDLRRRFSGKDAAHTDWHLDETKYTVKEVADRVREFMYDELYVPAARAHPKMPELGFCVVGYSAQAGHAEEYHLNLASAGCDGPSLLRGPQESGSTWSGQPEAISRLLMGYGSALPMLLEQDFGIDPAEVQAKLPSAAAKLTAQMINSAMPIQDAIDLADFLVDLSIKFSRFSPGSPTVGGPIEIAAITKHEGFKWIKRKYYFDSSLNPEDHE
jgi:hypothetical protein